MAGGGESKSSSSGMGFPAVSSMTVESDMGMSGGWQEVIAGVVMSVAGPPVVIAASRVAVASMMVGEDWLSSEDGVEPEGWVEPED